MSHKQTGLGRGFASLIPENFDDSILVTEQERIHSLSVTQLEPNPEQPRQHFDETELKGLAASIKRHGLLQPLVVTPTEREKYHIIAGERRWRAAQLAGVKKLPAIVRTTKQLEKLELALVENVQRVDLSPLEQAASIYRLHEQFSQEYEDVAKRLGKALSTITNMVRLLQLPKKAQVALQLKQISEGHARAILALREEAKQLELLNLIIVRGWSVRQAEQYVTAHKSGAKTSAAAERRLETSTPQTDKLGAKLRTKVSIKRTAHGGKLEIAFKNETDLKRILKHLC